MDVYLQEGELLCIVVYDDERLVGIAPLWVARKKQLGISTLKTLRFLGSEEVCGDHLDLIVSRKNSKEIITAIWNHLAGTLRRSWDIWEYHYVPADSEVLQSLYDIAEHDSRCLEVRISGYTVSPFIPLPETWEAYHSSISRSARGNLKSSLELLKQAGEIQFRPCESAEQLDEFMATQIELHRKSWHDRGQAGSYATHNFRRFHRELSQDNLAQGKLLLANLELNGQPIGSLYAFEHRRVMNYYLMGVDRSSVPKAGIGRVLLGFCIRESINRGCREFDMLRGLEEYKYYWADRERMDLLVTFHNRAFAALIHLFLQFTERFAKQTLTLLLGEKTMVVKRLLGRAKVRKVEQSIR